MFDVIFEEEFGRRFEPKELDTYHPHQRNNMSEEEGLR